MAENTEIERTVEWAIEQALPTVGVDQLHFAYGELLYTAAEHILNARERLLHERNPQPES